MATPHLAAPQAPGLASAASSQSLPVDSALTDANKLPALEATSESSSGAPEEPHTDAADSASPSTGAPDNSPSSSTQSQPPAASNATPQEKSTRDCQCGTRQQPIDTCQHYLATPPAQPPAAHLEPPALGYDLSAAGFRPPHYYYAPPPPMDHLQYPPPVAVPSQPGYYQNCYPYSYPLNLEFCYPQVLPHYLPHSYSPPKHQLLLLPNHYNQHHVPHRTQDLINASVGHPLSRGLAAGYQLYQHPASLAPFYTHLFPGASSQPVPAPQPAPLPPAPQSLPASNHHQLPSRSQAAHVQPQTYPVSPVNWYSQPHKEPLGAGPIIDTSSIEKLVSHLPIEAHPAEIRQAYGMDKVWNDEFEHLFSQLAPEVFWSFVEVESNPIIKDCDSILAYRGHYIIAKREADCNDSGKDAGFCEEPEEPSSCEEVAASELNSEPEQTEDKTETTYKESNKCFPSTGELSPETDLKEKDDEDEEKSSTSSLELANSKDSDCDSGAQTNCSSTSSETLTSNYQSRALNTKHNISPARSSNTTTRFRMFIDSAKVRFCCNQCGHGWTSMKGRVVFWYELFEVVEDEAHETDSTGPLIGYCAYKLFGQQCDICKVENRFERPMWYPEEVSKVLNNMYNKVGQVYFGFQMPPIDKQRRAGKPKTSHNSSLCQACQNGLCTDRK